MGRRAGRNNATHMAQRGRRQPSAVQHASAPTTRRSQLARRLRGIRLGSPAGVSVGASADAGRRSNDEFIVRALPMMHGTSTARDDRPLAAEVVFPDGAGLSPERALARLHAGRHELRQALQQWPVLCVRLGAAHRALTGPGREGYAGGEHLELHKIFAQPKLREARCTDGVVREYDPQLCILNTGKVDGASGPEAVQWHTDDTYCDEPARFTSLLARAVPVEGRGSTHFQCMHDAFDTLPVQTQERLRHLSAEHVQIQPGHVREFFGRWPAASASAAAGEAAVAEIPAPFVHSNDLESQHITATHPLIRAHPQTGREALYLNLDRMVSVLGLEDTTRTCSSSEAGAKEGEDDTSEAGLSLLSDLQRHADEHSAIRRYTHRWQRGDYLIWDNASVQHKAAGKETVHDGDERLFWQLLAVGTRPLTRTQWEEEQQEQQEQEKLQR